MLQCLHVLIYLCVVMECVYYIMLYFISGYRIVTKIFILSLCNRDYCRLKLYLNI